MTAGCHQQSSSWVVQEMRTAVPASSSKKLSYVNQNAEGKIGLEILKIEDLIEMVLILYDFTIPMTIEASKQIPLKLESEGEIRSTCVLRHAGGQKFTVNYVDTVWILEHLHRQKPVHLFLGGYKAQIEPKGFLLSYAQFKKGHSLRLPLAFPL